MLLIHRIALCCLLALTLANVSRADLFQQIPSPFSTATYLGNTASLSQYDTGTFTPPTTADLATMYDNFSFANPGYITSVDWIGKYETPFNPANPVTQFRIGIHANNAGAPGALVRPYDVITLAAANETSVISPEYFSYSASIAPYTYTAGATYWISIIGELDYALNGWGVAFSNLGDLNSYQDFQDDNTGLITRFNDSIDYAFNITAVPEPSSLLLMAVSATGLGLVRRRRS
jgi:hypothetical protein